ncbi:MAG TPA: diguanylate cyclase [Silvibacterium sp.]|nr:diguanylate cyclase [Silvibacterium sp.]
MLILATIGASICVSVAGWLLYGSAQRLSLSRDWLEHSQSVLSDLEQQSQRLDRLESNLQLYLLTHDENNLRNGQSTVVSFYSGALHLQQVVNDNAAQVARAQELENNASLLVKTVDSFTTESPFPSKQLFACRQVLAVMQAAERELLTQRTATAKSNASQSLAISVSFTVLSLAVVLVLFGFLLRDALHRRQYEERLSETNEKLAGTIRALERQARESDLLTAARDELQLSMNADQAQQSAVRYLGQLLPGTNGGICLIDDSRQLVEVDATWNGATALLDGFAPDACCGLRSGRTRWRRAGQSEVHCTHFASKPPENYLCLPLVAHGETLGMVYVECGSSGIAAMVDANLRALQQMVELASIRIAGLNLRTILEHQSIRDGLTNLFNRRFMEIALDRELRRALRHQKPLAVLMLDIDHFKLLNDTYGHEAGDVVLREVAAVMRQAVRSEDTICRYGGEEFVAILPELGIDDAFARAESIRHLVSELRLYYRGEALREITISIGLAVYPQNGESLDQLLSLADRALYEAKHLGRNRVVLAEHVTGSRPKHTDHSLETDPQVATF